MAEPLKGERDGLGDCISVVCVGAVRTLVMDAGCVTTPIVGEIIGAVVLNLMETGTVFVEGIAAEDTMFGMVLTTTFVGGVATEVTWEIIAGVTGDTTGVVLVVVTNDVSGDTVVIAVVGDTTIFVVTSVGGGTIVVVSVAGQDVTIVEQMFSWHLVNVVNLLTSFVTVTGWVMVVNCVEQLLETHLVIVDIICVVIVVFGKIVADFSCDELKLIILVGFKEEEWNEVDWCCDLDLDFEEWWVEVGFREEEDIWCEEDEWCEEDGQFVEIGWREDEW